MLFAMVLIIWFGAAVVGYVDATISTASMTGAWPVLTHVGLGIAVFFLFMWGLSIIADA